MAAGREPLRRATWRKWVLAAVCAPFLAGCETFEESHLIEQGVRVVSDMEEDVFGSRWWQFMAFNSYDFDVCVQVTLDPSSQTSGHSMGGVHQIASGASMDVGYINAPANFFVNAGVQATEEDGSCGYPPS